MNTVEMIDRGKNQDERSGVVGWVGWIQDLGFRHSHIIILTQNSAGAILHDYRLAKHSETFQ